MWQDLWPWLLGAVVVSLGGVALWMALRRPPQRPASAEAHADALMHWLEGRLEEARDVLREYVQRQPDAVEPYLHLGILYRLTGDPGRAAALHRGLAVRPGLSQERRVTVGLELAADLIDLNRWQEADEVLAQLAGLARHQVRWYLLRFAAAAGRDHLGDAVQSLREGEKRLAEPDAGRLRALRAAWLTDRALTLVRADRDHEAREALAQARGLAEADGRSHLVKALLAAHAEDRDGVVRSIEKGLAAHPAEMAPALPLIEGLLADAGHFLRVVPILEEACRRDDAPPSLWIALARLYDKLDRRDDALRLLAGKRGDPRLTPDNAAPYLRLLTAGHADQPFTRVWNLLTDPQRDRCFVCDRCGREEPNIRWYCPDCRSHDSFSVRTECRQDFPGDLVPSAPVLTEPPRY